MDSFLFSLSLLLLLQQPLTGLGHQQEDEEAPQQEAPAHDPKLEGDGDHHEGCDQGDGVKDVDQHRQHLPVEVRGDDRSEGGEDDNDWNTDGEETPGVLLDSCRRHHLPPVEADAGVDGHQDDGGWGGDLLADSEEQGETENEQMSTPLPATELKMPPRKPTASRMAACQAPNLKW